MSTNRYHIEDFTTENGSTASLYFVRLELSVGVEWSWEGSVGVFNFRCPAMVDGQFVDRASVKRTVEEKLKITP